MNSQMICITGVPGTGKSTIRNMLTDDGLQCISLDQLARSSGCVDQDNVDIDCLARKIGVGYRCVESHYSHLLECQFVIIMTTREDQLVSRLSGRGYGMEKIDENIGAQRADIIYYEALERLPASRIIKVANDDGTLPSAYRTVKNLIQGKF